MEKTIYDKNGNAVAYIAYDYYRETLYLWDGTPVGYVYEEEHLYGINGRHLGWFRDNVLFNNNGERMGFTHTSCPVSIAKAPPKGEKQSVHEARRRWSAPSPPKWGFSAGRQDFADFLREGQIAPAQKEKEKEEPKEGAPKETADQ